MMRRSCVYPWLGCVLLLLVSHVQSAWAVDVQPRLKRYQELFGWSGSTAPDLTSAGTVTGRNVAFTDLVSCAALTTDANGNVLCSAAAAGSGDITDVNEGLYIDVTNPTGPAPSVAFDPTELTGTINWNDSSVSTQQWCWKLSGPDDPCLNFADGPAMSTVGTFEADGFILGVSETLTMGTKTIAFSNSLQDFVFSDDVNVRDASPKIAWGDTTVGDDSYEAYADASQWYLQDVTDSVYLLRFDTTYGFHFRGSGVAYDWPTADGTNGQFLTTNGSGMLTWTTSSGSGDITSVGDCASGACFDGTQGTLLTFNNGSGDQTLEFRDATQDFEISNDLNVTDASPHIDLTDSGADRWELDGSDGQFRIVNKTDSTEVFKIDTANSLVSPTAAFFNGGFYDLGGSGDANGSGAVTSADATVIQGYLAGSLILTKDNYAKADINGDGRVNFLDLKLIQDFVTGLHNLDQEHQDFGKYLSDRAIDIDISSQIGIGTYGQVALGARLDVQNPTATSVTTEQISIRNKSQTVTLTDGTTIANQRGVQFLAPVLNGVAGGGTETVTNASTVYIDAAPSGSNITISNPFALNVAAGNVNFGGNLVMGADKTITLGSDTIQSSSGTGDIEITNDLNITDASPHLDLTDSGDDRWEIDGSDGQFRVVNVTDGKELIRFGTAYQTFLTQIGSCTGVLSTTTAGEVGCYSLTEGNAGIDISGRAISFDSTELNNVTWGDNSGSFTWTFDTSGPNGSMVFSSGTLNIVDMLLQLNGGPSVEASGSNFSFIGSLLPAISDSWGLGDAGKLWSNAYLSANGSLFFSTESLAFASGTSDFELSDDLTLSDTDPHLKWNVASGNDYEAYAFSSEWYLTDTTTGAVLLKASGASDLMSSPRTWTLNTLNLTNALTFGNGGTGLTTAADDTVMVSSGSAWQAKAVSDCQDSSGNHLNYTASTNSFSCGTSEANVGDVTAVGDCTTGACFNGSAGTVLTFENGGSDRTLTYDTGAADFSFNDDVNITDASPHLDFIDSGDDTWELDGSDGQFRLVNKTAAFEAFKVDSANNVRVDDNALWVDTTNNRVAVNSSDTTLIAPATLKTQQNNTSTQMMSFLQYSGVATNTNISFSMYAARGTPTAPTAVQLNDNLLNFGARGYGATKFSTLNKARILYGVAENWTDTAQGTYITFATTPLLSTTLTEAMRIDSTGNLGIGDTSPASLLTVGSGDKFQVNSSGLIPQYNSIATVSNGVPSELATVDTTGLTANVSATTAYAVPASGAGMYRVSSLVVETTAGSISSTLPNVQIVYTDNETGGSITIDATPILGVAGIGQTGALTANTVGTTSTGVIVINAKASTNIQYQTVNYASNLAGMAYALHIKLEAM